MKKWLILALALLLLSAGAQAECTCPCTRNTGEELPVFQGKQQVVFDTLKWSDAFPKSAQVISAMEYFCKAEEYQMHLMLIHATQNETVQNMYGFGAQILMLDMDDGNVYSYQNISYPETSEISSKEEALRLIYSAYDSFLNGYNEFVFSDQEIVYEISAEELDQINEALAMYFTK